MIIGRGVDVHDEEMGKNVRYDYVGCEYPTGIDPNQSTFFNNESIGEVIFEGYSDKGESHRLYKNYFSDS